MNKLKTTLLLIAFISLQFTVYSQSKSDTEKWIKNKIENYSFMDSEVLHEFWVGFEDEIIMIGTKISILANKDKIPYVHQYSIPIRDIDKVSFIEKPFAIHMRIEMRRNRNRGLIIDKNLNTNQSTTQHKIEIVMSNEINNNSLDTRIIDAFTHLIKLHGGSTIKEVF
jgi:hypothetical protein